MTHFLARLAERARGTAPRVEPLIVPHFAPSDLSGSHTVSEITTEIEAPAAATPASESKPAAATPLSQSKPVPRRARQALVENTPQTPPAETLDAEERRIEIVPEPLLIPQLPKHSQPLVVRQTQIERQVLEHPSGRVVLGREPAKPKTRRTKSQTPAQRPLPREHVAFSFAAEPRDQAPIVRVTIGRIDVRAAPPPAPPPRKAVQPAPPALTLDAYLKERKEGRR
jgi:hypothetical protein